MRIIIPGIPVPQARMRHSTRGKFVVTYDPKAKEKTVIRNILKTHKVTQSFEFPRVSFLFHMPIVKSVSKKDFKIYSSGFFKHNKKPDVDNLVKLYLDCLDGIIFKGDQKVSLGPCLKVYDKNPKTIVWINETKRQLQEWEMDNLFSDVLEFGK